MSRFIILLARAAFHTPLLWRAMLHRGCEAYSTGQFDSDSPSHRSTNQQLYHTFNPLATRKSTKKVNNAVARPTRVRYHVVASDIWPGGTASARIDEPAAVREHGASKGRDSRDSSSDALANDRGADRTVFSPFRVAPWSLFQHGLYHTGFPHRRSDAGSIRIRSEGVLVFC